MELGDNNLLLYFWYGPKLIIETIECELTEVPVVLEN